MEKTTKSEKFREIIQSSLKITARSVSIKTLLSERNLRRINYTPYYQRNFVWDNEKKSFFIESVIIGTEVPPLILFVSGNTVEVIDGRQRFETLKTFKEGDFNLSHKGLKELRTLKGQNFNKFDEKLKNVFLESAIRIVEFEVINHPNLSDDITDKIKKEIFRRYNTGITPLSRDELDAAKYESDEFSEYFKELLSTDSVFRNRFEKCFFPKSSNEDIISVSLDLIRTNRVLPQYPIAKYARGHERDSVVDILYDFTNNNSLNILSECKEFHGSIEKTIKLHESQELTKFTNYKLFFETVLWAYQICINEEENFTLSEQKAAEHLSKNSDKYTQESSFFYEHTLARYRSTAALFEAETNINFEEYIKSGDFTEQIKNKRIQSEDTEKSINDLENLRLHKPNPIAINIFEIREDLKSTNYLLRPSYQRQEKINQLKASSIIESILLGINLPPIFLYKRKSGIKEVVDGQQRLLSIIGFMGDNYFDEHGNISYSKNNNFKLKGLQVLDNLEGKRYSDLTEHYQDKILDFVVDVIVIEESRNEAFDPIDLFIRLNYKPYPIKPNSFEMWNSTVDSDVIRSIKTLSFQDSCNWFYLRQRIADKPDRMLNEELLITLAYMNYRYKNDSEEVVGFFPRQDTVTCRLKDKKRFSDFLFNLDDTAFEKKKFIESITDVERMINFLSRILGEDVSKNSFDEFLNVNNSGSFRRTLQDFYVIWLVIMPVYENFSFNLRESLVSDIRDIMKFRSNPENKIIDDNYVNDFLGKINTVREKYKSTQ